MRSSARHDGSSPPRGAGPPGDVLLEALTLGDPGRFAQAVDRLSPAMLRMALVHVPSRAVAEEVVQEAWLTVLTTFDRFEGRSAVRTWVLGIVVNLARSRGRAERRSMPAGDATAAEDEPLFGHGRFRPAGDAWPGHWALGPVPWPTPEEELLAGETRRVVLAAIAALPAAQREVLVMRDLEGFSSHEACEVLGLTDGNQRVLLHRARSRVRTAIEDHLGATEPT